MNDENSNPSVIAITVVITYRDKVFIPNLDIETSSERDTMPQTMEKKMRGIIINFRDVINK